MSAGPKLGLISLGGSLPPALAKTLQANGTDIHCLCFEGITDPAIHAYPHSTIRFLKVGEMFRALRKAECKQLVFVGHLFRPNIRKIRFDLTTLKYLPLILLSQVGGDDALIRKVTRAFEREGFEVLSLKDVAPVLVAQSGQMGKYGLSLQMENDVAYGLKVLQTLGLYDVGQAVVVDRQRVIAIEAAEGTDEMLRRVQSLRGSERYDASKRSGILIKAAKPQQHLRDDMPVIGLETVRNAIAAGLEGIAVESGRVITADLPELVTLADEHKLAIAGVTGRGDD